MIVPFFLWLGLVQLRPHLLKTRCASPASFSTECSPKTVPPIDRPGLGIENPAADGYSYQGQNLSGALAVAVPLLWNATLPLIGSVTPAAALAAAGTDLVIFLETSGINGSVTEAARLLVQRPRPYVYGDPVRARDPQNYVSFYSGHTSFAAAACACLLLILLSRGAPTALLLVFGSLSECLVIATAAYRILAGRHFMSDVLVGAVMGTLIAIAVAWLHRPSVEL